MDRKHDPVPETIVGDCNVFAMDQQPRLDHRLHRNSLGGESIAQGVFFGQGIAQAKFCLQPGIEAPRREIGTGRASLPTGEPRGKIGRREGQHLMQARPRLFLCLGLGRNPWQGEPRVMGKPLDRFRERKPLSLHQKIEDIAVFACRMIEPGHLLVIDKK